VFPIFTGTSRLSGVAARRGTPATASGASRVGPASRRRPRVAWRSTSTVFASTTTGRAGLLDLRNPGRQGRRRDRARGGQLL